MSTEHHVVPKKIYYTIFGILMLCTYLTVQIAFFDLGELNTVAALGIAVLKATLVVLFFMVIRVRTQQGSISHPRDNVGT